MVLSANAHGGAPAVIEKVTAFVIRSSSHREELLLIAHPHGGIQIPAGTVEANEALDAAALREAREETGLTGLEIICYLGARDDPPLPGHVFVCENTTVFSRPDSHSFDWATLPRGAMVKLERGDGGYTQVTFEELDRWPDSNYVTYRISGWVPNEALAPGRTRHFYQLACRHATEETWEVDIVYHRFRLFWAPLDDLPEIVSPQVEWLDVLWRERGNAAEPQPETGAPPATM
jgi:8-oxo-dGTP pyrophosphatase MutT (NUDIX family)